MSDTAMAEARRVRRAIALFVGAPVVLVSGMLTVMFAYALVTGVRGPLGGGAATKAISAIVAFIVCLGGVRLLRLSAGVRSERSGSTDGR